MLYYAKEQSLTDSASFSSFQRIPANGNKAEAKLREIEQTAETYMQTLPANLQRYAQEFGMEVA